MRQHLLLTVHLHGDGQGTARFHGVAQGAPEWPPSPARVFQALVAGAARGNALPEDIELALEWLERLPPPLVAAPLRHLGQSVSLFVPNNDADSLSDPRDVSGIRTKKVLQPSLFAEGQPFLYAWPLPSESGHAGSIVKASAELYQLGRGIDMAWAVAEVLDDDGLQARLEMYRGSVHLPELGTRGERMLACPVDGSLASLIQRHRTPKLRSEGGGRTARVLFTNPPKPRFLSVSYERSRRRVVFELRDRVQDKLWPWALDRVVRLVEKLRDGAAERLRQSLPGCDAEVEATLVGRKADGSNAAPIAHRARILPLPSIGSSHADCAIRRFLLDVPSGASLRNADVEWAFSGLEWAHPGTGEMSSLVVMRNDDDSMLHHYVGPSRRWRSITAVALPDNAKRRRIEPTRKRDEAKGASERRAEEDRAVAAVHTALRHAGIRGIATAVRVQREPFESAGKRAELFAEGTRFAKERLWHVEVTLDRAVEGPLVIGDGRFLGLGMMAPVNDAWSRPADAGQEDRHPALTVSDPRGLIALEVSGDVKDEPANLARALRRAVMARVQCEVGRERLAAFFSGHEDDGRQVGGEGASHLAFQWDSRLRRLLVIAPHQLDRREPTWQESRYLEVLDKAFEGFVELRAGPAGRFAIRRIQIETADPLLRSTHSWMSLTPYAVTRHLKRSTANETLVSDVIAECQRRRLPRPDVTVIDSRGVQGSGLEGRLRLDFSVAVSGPIVIGRTRYLGGGLFVPSRPSDAR